MRQDLHRNARSCVVAPAPPPTHTALSRRVRLRRSDNANYPPPPRAKAPPTPPPHRPSQLPPGASGQRLVWGVVGVQARGAAPPVGAVRCGLVAAFIRALLFSGDRGAAAFAGALKTNATLQHLELAYNQIAEAGAAHFGEVCAGLRIALPPAQDMGTLRMGRGGEWGGGGSRGQAGPRAAPGAGAPLCIGRSPAHRHLRAPSSVTERYRWSRGLPTSPIFFVRFCADRRLCTRAIAQNCFGGGGGQRPRQKFVYVKSTCNFRPFDKFPIVFG